MDNKHKIFPGALLVKRNLDIYWILAVLVPVFYASLLADKTLPYAEGWYTYYSQLINSGEVVYRDFQYLFSPLYIYFMALFTRLFGYSILAVRILGVIVFGGISAALYYTINRVFSKPVAMISTIAGVFYLQSEIVQVFYDYVRFMDIASILSTGFLAAACIQMRDNDLPQKHLVFGGISAVVFFLIKQNMGLLYFVYGFILVIFSGVIFRKTWKDTCKYALQYSLPFISGIILAFLLLQMNGSLSMFLQSTSAGAVEAKGGIFAILFNWIINGLSLFIDMMPKALLVIGLFLTLWLLCEANKDVRTEKSCFGEWIGILCAVGAILGMAVLAASQWAAMGFFKRTRAISPYLIFDIVTPTFFVLGILYFVQRFRPVFHGKGEQILKEAYPVFAIAGGYFAVSYGCGTSGGLAEGQAPLGVALVIAALLTVSEKLLLRKNLVQYIGVASYLGICGLSLLLVFTCAAKKMVYTYNWWGMTESNYWSSDQKVEDIPLLRGIKLSETTKNLYEGIYSAITEHTTPDDTIFCFPQIPIFYSICDRVDPGTYSKVQWFDVATDSVIMHDIEIIKQTRPKAILIYDTSEYAYSSHESAFRKGEISGTRKMKEFLLNYVWEQGYSFWGKYESEGNALLLWILEDFAEESGAMFDSGSGTSEDPYIITNEKQLMGFSKQVMYGRSFQGQYIELGADIDCSKIDSFTPIGEFGSGHYFYGVFNGNGYCIENLTIHSETENAGLFGYLCGKVYNLGLTEVDISGVCAGGIASYTSPESEIANCYVTGDIKGYRAGGIVDNITGRILNCYFAGSLDGAEVNAVSFPNSAQEIMGVYTSASIFSQSNRIEVKHKDIIHVPDWALKSGNICKLMNRNLEKIDLGEVTSNSWKATGNGYPILVR